MTVSIADHGTLAGTVTRERRSFGRLRKCQLSGRFQASYVGPDNKLCTRVSATLRYLRTYSRLIKAHLASEHVEQDRDALLFPATAGEHLQPSTLYRHFYKARPAAERDDLRFHDLRHAGATMAAQTGATLAELMARIGHSTPAAADPHRECAAAERSVSGHR